MADVIDGTAMRIRIDGVAVLKATNCSISLSRETRTRSHKDVTGSWQATDYGLGSCEASGEALFAEGEGYESLYTAMIDKTKVTVEMSTNVTGSKKTTFEGCVTSLEMNAPNAEDTTFSYTIAGDGAPTRATL